MGLKTVNVLREFYERIDLLVWAINFSLNPQFFRGSSDFAGGPLNEQLKALQVNGASQIKLHGISHDFVNLHGPGVRRAERAFSATTSYSTSYDRRDPGRGSASRIRSGHG
jgi:hypothetical protein